MAAPKGNEFWKKRSKHGRDKLFASPELLWQACEQYFRWCVNNPLMELEQVKNLQRPYKDKGKWVRPSQFVELPKMRPFTIQGLCRYLDTNSLWFNEFEEAIKLSLKDAEKKDDPLIKGFSIICLRVREIIYDQKFTGAATGFFNANIISRDLGLADKQEARQTDKDGNDVKQPLPAINITVYAAGAPIAESEE